MLDGLTIEYTADAGRGERRRIRLERTSDGFVDFVEEYHNGCRWCSRGHEFVTDVHIEGATGGAVVLEGGPP